MSAIIKQSACLFAVLCLSFNAAAYDAIYKISGRIQPGTCTLLSSSVVNVKLNDVYLSNTGLGSKPDSVSDKVDWNIVLECPSDIPVIINPAGTTVSGKSNLLAIAPATDAASGVGIETEYKAADGVWRVLELNKTNTIVSTVKNDGILTLNFRGYYRQTAAEIAPGTANATLDLNIVYK
ncbi:fimbrial protein [Morganella morganii subsp. sibonii]|uniref:fimbrial protein n=1 Tax=Morganella sp. Je.2.23 TaxID=3142840 RepID=UPI003099D830